MISFTEFCHVILALGKFTLVNDPGIRYMLHLYSDHCVLPVYTTRLSRVSQVDYDFVFKMFSVLQYFVYYFSLACLAPIDI